MRSDDHRVVGGGNAAASRPWWLAGVVVALGCVCLYGAFSLPQAARYAGVGPGLFVTAVGLALVLLGAMLAVQIARGEEFVAQDSDGASGRESADMRALLTAVAAAVLPILTVRALGMPLTAMLSFTLVARAFGSRRPLVDLAVGAVLGIVSWYLLTRLGLQLGGVLPVAGL